MMLAQIKGVTRASIGACARAFGQTRIGRVFFAQAVDAAMTRTLRVAHRGTELMFAVPNEIAEARARTFSTKEPETLSWIDAIPEGAVLWDVGANVGLYSCYAARARGCRVVAFEPSVFNLELLARNIFLNRLTDKVIIVALPLCTRLQESTLNMTTTAWGGALSTFGADHGFDGRALQRVFEFRTVGLSMDECAAKLGLPQPQFIKMDVDGIEHLILQGGAGILRQVQGVSVEINDAFTEQAQDCERLLSAAGLRFVGKAHSDMIEHNPTYNSTFNQVWAR
jgi:FkbM family methyltransferase